RHVVLFNIEIDVTYDGRTFNITVDLARRVSQTLLDCLSACSINITCVGTAYDREVDTCTYYSSIVAGSQCMATNVTFATVEARNQTSLSSSVSSTVPSTSSNLATSYAGNSTMSSSTTMTLGASFSVESLLCPQLDGAIIVSDFQISYEIDCSHGPIGTTFAIDGPNRKYQSTRLPQSLSNSVELSSTSDACVGTTFMEDTSTCMYYNTVTSSFIASGMDSALRIQTSRPAATTVTAVTTQVITTNGATQTVTNTVVQTVCPSCAITAIPVGAQTGAISTATVHSTTVYTVFSCAPTVTYCPLRNGQNNAVVTTVVPVAVTQYICTVPSQQANVVTALFRGVTVQDVTTTAVYQCSLAGNTYTIGSSTIVPSVPTAVTSYITQVTQRSSAATAIMTGSDAAATIVYYVVVTTETSGQGSAATSAGQDSCVDKGCLATIVNTMRTVVPVQSGPSATALSVAASHSDAFRFTDKTLLLFGLDLEALFTICLYCTARVGYTHHYSCLNCCHRVLSARALHLLLPYLVQRMPDIVSIWCRGVDPQCNEKW
ncbi:hypothetical protein D6C86_10604, partial [Aureobasidium pullulans]